MKGIGMKMRWIAGTAAFLALSGLAHADAGHAHSGQHGHASKQDSIGVPGKASEAKRVVKVDMNDTMRFTPASIQVKRGETVRFVVTNSGKLKHEMVLGSQEELKEHAEMMRRMPDMEHADENMVSVAPGKSGELIWKFTKSGKVDFACLQPGHPEAGMVGKIEVK